MRSAKALTAFKKIGAEFLLIVIGVTIALWLENEFEKIKELEVEQAYIASFEQDWLADIKELKAVIRYNKSLKERTENLFNGLHSNKISDSELPSRVFVIMNYQYFSPQDFTFQSIQETGDFKLIRDPNIKRSLLKLRSLHASIKEAQANYQQALDNYIVPLVNQNINLAQQSVVNSDFLQDHRLTNLVLYTINDLDGRIKLCETTLKFLESLVSDRKAE